MANYKLKYAGEKIDELLTKIDNLGTGTDTKSGTVKLSSATDSNSGVSDGVAATPKAVSQLKADMNTKANKTDVLSLEEIQASTDLSGKIASASSVNELDSRIYSDIISSNSSKIIHFPRISAIVCISRVDKNIYSFYAIDYWSNAAQLIGGNSTNITLTKEALSNEVTISNNIGYSVAVIVIS